MNDYVYEGKYPKDTYLISQKCQMIIKIWHYEFSKKERKVCYYVILAVDKDRGIYKDNINIMISHEEYIHNNFYVISKEEVENYLKKVDDFGNNLF